MKEIYLDLYHSQISKMVEVNFLESTQEKDSVYLNHEFFSLRLEELI